MKYNLKNRPTLMDANDPHERNVLYECYFESMRLETQRKLQDLKGKSGSGFYRAREQAKIWRELLGE